MEKKYWTKKEIIGCFAKWILRQYPHWEYQEKLFFPAIKEIQKCLDNWEDQKIGVLGIIDVQDFVRSIISVCPAIKEYNRNEKERSGGAKTPDYALTDRYSDIKPEYDFIDLGALERNITNELIQNKE